MSTENVALLFTDMVGSTAHYQRLAPDAADEVRRDHFAVLRSSLEDAGGVEVKNLGDGLMAVFASASAALACAGAMQQAVEANNRGGDATIELRVGVSGGEVVHEEDDYFGDAVIEAARLCAACEPGQIMVSEVVRMMAGRRSRATFRPLGPIALKGLPDPVPAAELQWEPLPPRRSPVPFPPRLAAQCTARIDLVGREAELAALAAAVKRTAEAEGREVVLVSGEPGQGKTSLAAEAARRAFDEGACVLLGHSEEGLTTPYGLFAEAFRHWAGHADVARLGPLVAAHGAEWSRFVPAFAERGPRVEPSKGTDPDSERYLLFAAAVELLAGIAEDEPVVLVLDDLQWADPASLALLRHVTAAEDRLQRMLVIGVFRGGAPLEPAGLQETLGQLWRNHAVSRIELGGLDSVAVASLLETVTGAPLDASGVDLAEAVHHESSGNPFFVTEMLRHLRETGAIVEDRAGDGAGGRVRSRALEGKVLPTSLRESINGRVVRLGTDSARVLSMAAVAGKDFDIDVLRLATELPVDALLDLLEAAVQASLVAEVDGRTGRFAFTHALVQRTIYDGLGPARRSYFHEQVALALEALADDGQDPRVDELAHHWIESPRPGRLDKAIQYSHAAAVAALSSLAPDDAALHYTNALQLCAEAGDVPPPLLVEMTIGLGTAQRQMGRPEFRETLLGAAREAVRLEHVGHLTAACLANDRGFYSAVGSTDADKVEALELALTRVPDGHPDRALVLATLCSELTHGSTLERRRALAEEAVEIAGRSDEAVLVRVLNHLHVPLQVPSLLELTGERAAEALVRAQRVDDPVLIFWAAQWAMESAARVGDIEAVDRCLAIHGSMSEILGQPVFRWGHSFVRSFRAQISGDVERAERCATEAFDIGTESGQPDAALIFGAQMNIVAGQRGTQHALVPLIERMAEETPDIPRSFWVSLLAKAHAEGDDRGRASALLAEAATTGYESALDQLWLTGLVDLADAAIDCEETVHAAALFDLLEPWADQLPSTSASVLSPVSHYLGGLATVLGRYEVADKYFECASQLCERMQAKFFSARTKLRWGTMLARRGGPGDRRRARQLLVEARKVSAVESYAVVERRASEMLDELSTVSP